MNYKFSNFILSIFSIVFFFKCNSLIKNNMLNEEINLVTKDENEKQELIQFPKLKFSHKSETTCCCNYYYKIENFRELYNYLQQIQLGPVIPRTTTYEDEVKKAMEYLSLKFSEDPTFINIVYTQWNKWVGISY